MATGTHVHLCPECGGDARRVHRHLGDRVIALVHDVRRYRCMRADCGWEGIVSPRVERHTESAAVVWTLGLVGAAVLIAIAVATLGGLRTHRSVAQTSAEPVRIAAVDLAHVPDGDTFDGLPLPADDHRVTAHANELAKRRGCAWGVPGRDPYRGTVPDALAGAGLPPDVVRKVDAMVARGLVSDRVEITRTLIQTTSGKRRFDPTLVAMGFGKTLCFGTRVNFKRGHVELGDLYDATDGDGRKYSVMVPDTCRNVAVLAERAERDETNGKRVPEPATLWLLAAAAAGWLATQRFPGRSR